MADKEKDTEKDSAKESTKESAAASVGGFHIYNTDVQRAAALAQTGLKSDRRLYLTGDRARIVEEGDPESRYLLVPAGGTIPVEEATRLNLDVSGGKVKQKGPAKAMGNDAAPTTSEEAETPKAAWKDTPPPEVVLNMAPEHTSLEETPEGATPASEQTSPTLRTAFDKDKAREIREEHPVQAPIRREPVAETETRAPATRATTTTATTPRKTGAKKGRT